MHTEIVIPAKDLPALEGLSTLFEIKITGTREMKNVVTGGPHQNITVILNYEHASALFEMGRSYQTIKDHLKS